MTEMLTKIIASLKEKNDFSILYIEDDLLVQESMMLILKRFCTDVTVANNGSEGWEAYQKRPYSVVITDLQMPHMNGMELIRKIREINPLQIIIIISAFHNDDEFKNTIAFHVNYTLPKPLILQDFLNVLYDISLIL